MSNKYEQLIEFIINDEQDKARELFHNIVVAKSRDIYESLIDEQDLEEVGGNQVDDLVDEVTTDEIGISEEEDEGAEDDAMDFDMGGDDDAEGAEDDTESEDLEDRVVDLEDALDELKAEFDALMAGEDSGEEGGEEEFGGEEEGEEFGELAEGDDCDEDEEEMDESIVREYVEKAPAPTTSEEGSINKKSTVAGKNDMGGSSANIAKGGANQNPDGTGPKGAVKAKGNLPHAGSYENVPGGNAGKAFSKKESAVKKEEGSVAKHSPVAK